MKRKSFPEKVAFWNQKGNFLIVGLDIELKHIPQAFRDTHAGLTDTQLLLEFTRYVTEITSPYCAGWKPNLKFYEAASGRARLEDILEDVSSFYPNHILIGDNKDNDIGNTIQQSVAYNTKLQLDAFTANPLMGYRDSMDRMLSNAEVGVFALCLTSNEGKEDILKFNDLYLHIAGFSKNKESWNSKDNYHLVVGATNTPEEIKAIREAAGDESIFLMPGFGAQGGDVKKAIAAARNSKGGGFLGVVARHIIAPDPHGGESYEDAVKRSATEYRDAFAEAAQVAS